MIETATDSPPSPRLFAPEGLSGVFVGPNDLALSLGVAPSMDTSDREVTKLSPILGSTATAAILSRNRLRRPAYGTRMRERGYRLFVVSSDLRMMIAHAKKPLQT